MGYDVLSSTIDVYYDDELYRPAGGNDVPLGIIIGCSVGGAVLIGLIIFVVYKVKQRNANKVNVGEESVDIPRKKEWSMNEIQVESL